MHIEEIERNEGDMTTFRRIYVFRVELQGSIGWFRYYYTEVRVACIQMYASYIVHIIRHF